LPSAAEKNVSCCNSAGIAPTKVTPGTCISSLDLLKTDFRLAARHDGCHRLA